MAILCCCRVAARYRGALFYTALLTTLLLATYLYHTPWSIADPPLRRLRTYYLPQPSTSGTPESPYPDPDPLHKQVQQQDLEPSGSLWKHTTLPGGAYVHGFTLFDNLYLRNGTLYVITPNPTSFPPRQWLLSKPIEMEKDTTPTDDNLQFIQPDEAPRILGDYQHITRAEGFSVVLYDPNQYMKHYYHWFGEIILGLWRVYSHLLLERGSLDAQTPLPSPSRFIVPFVENEAWRDRDGVDGPLMRAAFPGVPIEGTWWWRDMKELGTTVLFERAMLVNRVAAHKHPYGGVWFKMMAGTMNVTAPPNFWEPIRNAVIQNTASSSSSSSKKALELSSWRRRPLITYISRQGSGRRLVAADHDNLIAELRKLEAEGLCEVKVAVMEKMSVVEQIKVAARTTILVGVHGNGLTHQLWMPPSPLSTTIEILIPKGYTFDYEMLARNMGHKHYAVWNDTFLTYEAGLYHKGVQYPQGFHGVIPVHGPTVAEIIRAQLAKGV